MIILKYQKKKKLVGTELYTQQRDDFKKEDETKLFFKDVQKVKEFLTSRAELQEMLKEVL